MTRQQSLDREAYWQGVMREQESSGLSISAFCRKGEVAEGSFFYWRRKLKNRQSSEESGTKDKTVRQSRPRKNTVAKFVPVDIPVPNGRSGVSCEVVLPNGCRIIVPTQSDDGWLCEIDVTQLSLIVNGIDLRSAKRRRRRRRYQRAG